MLRLWQWFIVHAAEDYSLFFPGLFGDAYISCGSLVEIVHKNVVL